MKKYTVRRKLTRRTVGGVPYFGVPSTVIVGVAGTVRNGTVQERRAIGSPNRSNACTGGAKRPYSLTKIAGWRVVYLWRYKLNTGRYMRFYRHIRYCGTDVERRRSFGKKYVHTGRWILWHEKRAETYRKNAVPRPYNDFMNLNSSHARTHAR